MTTRKYYLANKEKIKEATYKWRKNNPEKVREAYRRWYIKNGRTRDKNYADIIYDWQKKNPEKHYASVKVYRALKDGLIKKPNICSICKRLTRLSGHHTDYSKPLEVIWVCSSCYKKIHSTK
jgi:hypothetical protein